MQDGIHSHDYGYFNVNYFEKDALLGFFISQICWVVVLWVVKCSILAFYWRLFSRNSRLTRFLIWTIATITMCWGVAVVRLLSFIKWSFLSVVADSYKGLVIHNDLPMFPYRFVLGMGLR